MTSSLQTADSIRVIRASSFLIPRPVQVFFINDKAATEIYTMMRRAERFLKCERGTQMIEFALLLPFLIVLFASAVEMGRMFYTYTTLQKSTEVGARYLSSALATGGTYSASDTNTATNLVVCGTASNVANGCSGLAPVANNLTASNVTITAPGTAIGTSYAT